MCVIQQIDGISFKMKENFDFSFLQEYGKVFKVFDDQDSGNICFGTEQNGKRYFIKFAGAPTVRGVLEGAVERLKTTLPVYRDLQHPYLIHLLDAYDVAGGFAMIFEWQNGECMGKMYPESHDNFMAMSLEKKLQVFHDVTSFLEYVALQKYVAVDFYDGSIMYDFETGRTSICDIDFFLPMPCVNTMGRMWGSSRFMSPEEYELGAVIDEVTNVYTLGAMAFALFADSDRSREKWPLSDALYKVASKAVASRRCERYESIQAFSKAWNLAV